MRLHKNIMVKFRKTDPSSMISSDLIKSVFVKYESYLCNEFKCDLPEILSENEEFVKNSYQMCMIIISFNNSEYRDGDIRSYSTHPGVKYQNYLKRRYGCDRCKSQFDAKQYSNPLERASFPALVRLLFLLYEIKFIYGDINSRINTFHFIPVD
ncbi:hypothetical protein RF11_09771 [Thelohanellus kitauei]|uniref:Uncharacterized protein n=1 Tax=Thelohanellus kitauei TaxID=669202 RepID=A0A0C2IHK6_THEKT|nr:hypothetical protein RF11_09771 [Thelohanellus kitauei]